MRLLGGRVRAVGLAVVLAGGALAAWLATAGPRTADPDRLWREADADAQEGHYDRVEGAVARLARLRSPTPQDWYLRAKLAMARGRTDEALSDLARIPDADPLGATARLRAGQIELQRGRWRHAESALLDATRLDPGLVQAHRELIFLYGAQSRRAELHARYRALAELGPLTFDDVFSWCLARTTVNWEPAEVVKTMTRCLRADPEDRRARLALAGALRRLGRIDDAEAALKPLPPSDPEARALRAEIALDRGDDRAAAALLAGGPDDHPDLARLRGRLALARHDGPAALPHFRAAYRAEPDDRDTLFGLAAALTLAGDRAAAAPYLAVSRRLDALSSLVQRAAAPAGRRDRKLLRQLGAACEAADRLPEARAWYRLVIAADPTDAEAQRSLRRVQTALDRSRGTRAGP